MVERALRSSLVLNGFEVERKRSKTGYWRFSRDVAQGRVFHEVDTTVKSIRGSKVLDVIVAAGSPVLSKHYQSFVSSVDSFDWHIQRDVTAYVFASLPNLLRWTGRSMDGLDEETGHFFCRQVNHQSDEFYATKLLNEIEYFFEDCSGEASMVNMLKSEYNIYLMPGDIRYLGCYFSAALAGLIQPNPNDIKEYRPSAYSYSKEGIDLSFLFEHYAELQSQ